MQKNKAVFLLMIAKRQLSGISTGTSIVHRSTAVPLWMVGWRKLSGISTGTSIVHRSTADVMDDSLEKAVWNINRDKLCA